jgi:hypothetical protein
VEKQQRIHEPREQGIEKRIGAEFSDNFPHEDDKL